MAGFTKDIDAHSIFEFHIDTPDVAKRIRAANKNKPVVTLQLDGDELDAALWGLEHYRKGSDSSIEGSYAWWQEQNKK